jgi:outer membrane murein-binding lipoprotein Lpp
MGEVKNGSRWFTIAMMAISLTVGIAGAGGVASMKINELENEVDEVKLEQTDRLGRLEQKVDDMKEDIDAIRKYVERQVERELTNGS